MSEILEEINSPSQEFLQNETPRRFGHTVFESMVEPVEAEYDTKATGPTQSPTHLGGQFMGIDQDRDS